MTGMPGNTRAGTRALTDCGQCQCNDQSGWGQKAWGRVARLGGAELAREEDCRACQREAHMGHARTHVGHLSTTGSVNWRRTPTCEPIVMWAA